MAVDLFGNHSAPRGHLGASSRVCYRCGVRRARPDRRLCGECSDHRTRYQVRAKRIARYGSISAFRREQRRREGRPTMAEYRESQRIRKERRALELEERRKQRGPKVMKPWTVTGDRAATVRMRRQMDPEYRQYDIYRAFVRKRRLRHASDGTVSVSALRELRAKSRRCYLCRKPLNGKTAFDHVIPIARGGTHSMSNLAVVHHACNAKKAARELALC